MTLPNQLSVLRIILTPFFVITYLVDNLTINYLSFVIFFIAALTDYYDGILARKYGVASLWGKFLDPLADKILVSSALLVFAWTGVIHSWMVIIIIVRDIIITALRSYAMFKRKPIVTSFFAKAKTFTQIGVIYFIFIFVLMKKTVETNNQEFFLVNFITSWNLIYISMLFITLLTLVSGIKYLIENRDHLKSIALDFYHVFIPSDS
jgi:CDP-diacylglycerol--glycerol-3-phosphate 3-phosphatidyltransferase